MNEEYLQSENEQNISAAPTPEPLAAPTPEPLAAPTPEPLAAPTPEPLAEPTPEPLAEPTPEPLAETAPVSSLLDDDPDSYFDDTATETQDVIEEDIIYPEDAYDEDDIKSQTSGQAVSDEDMWRLKNYSLLKDYLDRTISRIAARCVRSGNIAIEEYKFYGYVLDVLDELCETGDYLLERSYLATLIDEQISGGVLELKRRIPEFRQELQANSSPDMVKSDDAEVDAAKAILGLDGFDPTEGAGMSMDDVISKLAEEHNKAIDDEENSEDESEK
ncbi:MAG: hypothetical protein R3Y43_04910 [Alphaproteobacteria bacterium]